MPVKRRQVLAVSTLTLLCGCLTANDLPEGEDEQGGDDEGEKDVTGNKDTCEFDEGTWRAEGDPIESTVTLESEPDRALEPVCADAAATAAFDELNAQTDIDLESQSWINAAASYDGEYTASVWVLAEEDQDGNYWQCPDPEFEVSAARSDLPKEVTVTVELDYSNEMYSCTHSVELTAQTEMLE